MKKVLVLLAISIIIFSMFSSFVPQLKAEETETTIFEDDFESYAAGSFPSAGGWEIVWSGRGSQYQVVSDAYSYSGIKSFQTWGQTGWSAVVQRKFTSDAEVIGYELAIMIEKRSTEYDDYVGFFNREVYVWGRYYATVYFSHRDSTIKAGGGILGTWSPSIWYKVKVKLDRSSNT